MTRRKLVAALGGSLLARAQGKKVRLGMAGFDGHPEEIWRPLARMPDVELVAIADAGSAPDALSSALKQPVVVKALRYPGLKEMLANVKLDMVAVCNNNGARAAAILACAERKLDVIAEKPLGLNRGELDAVYAAVKRNGIHLGMLLPMRFDPPYLAMRRIVESGTIGEVLQMDAQKSYQLGARPAWQTHAATYGSTLLWIGIHGIDLMLWVSGRRFTEAASLQSHVRFPEVGDMQNVTATIFKMDNGGMATLRMDYLRPGTAGSHGDDRLRVAGTKGIVEYQESTGVTLVTNGAKPVTVKDLPPQGSVFADYVQWVMLGKKPALAWDEIVRANEAMLAAEAASVSHRFVAVRG
jgi:predicted dehydrogenase